MSFMPLSCFSGKVLEVRMSYQFCALLLITVNMFNYFYNGNTVSKMLYFASLVAYYRNPRGMPKICANHKNARKEVKVEIIS